MSSSRRVSPQRDGAYWYAVTGVPNTTSIGVRIIATQSKQWECAERVDVRFYIDRQGQVGKLQKKPLPTRGGQPRLARKEFAKPSDAREEIGYLTGYIIHKEHDGDDLPWIEEMLQLPEDHDEEDILFHADDGELDDVSRAMQNLYDHDGVVQDRFEDIETQLIEAPAVHEISEYRLDDEIRGLGLGPIVMQAYLRSLAKGFFTGPVILTPAPFSEVFSAEARANPSISWCGQKKKLVSMYEKAGFEIWCNGDLDTTNVLTVMGQFVQASGGSPQKTVATQGPAFHQRTDKGTVVPRKVRPRPALQQSQPQKSRPLLRAPDNHRPSRPKWAVVRQEVIPRELAPTPEYLHAQTRVRTDEMYPWPWKGMNVWYEVDARATAEGWDAVGWDEWFERRLRARRRRAERRRAAAAQAPALGEYLEDRKTEGPGFAGGRFNGSVDDVQADPMALDEDHEMLFGTPAKSAYEPDSDYQPSSDESDAGDPLGDLEEIEMQLE